MSVLRYCCFRWLVYDRALVFEPSRPLACNMMLVWLILLVELCCDIFPWVPDLDRTRLRVWLVYGRIGGVTVHEGPTRVGGAPYPPRRALRPCGRLMAPPTSSPSLLVIFWSKKNHHKGFIPFGLCLVFLFCETVKQGKKQKLALALGSRLIG